MQTLYNSIQSTLPISNCIFKILFNSFSGKFYYPHAFDYLILVYAHSWEGLQ